MCFTRRFGSVCSAGVFCHQTTPQERTNLCLFLSMVAIKRTLSLTADLTLLAAPLPWHITSPALPAPPSPCHFSRTSTPILVAPPSNLTPPPQKTFDRPSPSFPIFSHPLHPPPNVESRASRQTRMNTERNRGGNIEQRAGTWVFLFVGLLSDPISSPPKRSMKAYRFDRSSCRGFLRTMWIKLVLPGI